MNHVESFKPLIDKELIMLIVNKENRLQSMPLLIRQRVSNI